MADILLIAPNEKLRIYGDTASKYSAIQPNIYMALIEAYLSSKNIDVMMIDGEVDDLTNEELANLVISIQPKLVGIVATGVNPSSSTMSMVSVISFFELLNSKLNEFDKAPTTFVVGGHPTVLPERTYSDTHADFVIIGEGYETIEQLYFSIESNDDFANIPGLGFSTEHGFNQNPAPDLIDVDVLPQINWHKMDPTKYRAHNWHCFGDDIDNRSPYAVLWTSMGCPYPCEFCCINNVFGKRTFRFRSMEKVVQELDDLVQNYNVKHLKILDELFVIKHKRIDEFCDLLEERQYDLNIWCYARVDSVTPRLLQRLSKVGVRWIGYGFEAGDNEEALTSVDKRVRNNSPTPAEVVHMTRQAKINIVGHAILGLWDDDEQAIFNNRDFLYKHEFEWNNIYPTFAYPGTPLYDKYLAAGIIDEPSNWECYGLYSYECEPLPTKYLTAAEVLQLRDTIFTEIYTNENTLSMLEAKFGLKTRLHVEEMVKRPLRRRIIEEQL